MDQDQIQQLLIDAQSGNKKSYKKFYQQVVPIIVYMVNAKVFNPNDRDDVIQEALLGIHKSLESYDPKRAALPWIRTITNYKIIDYIRKYTKKNAHETLTSDGDVTIFGLTANSSLEDLQILAGLPKKLQQPLILTKIKGYSTAEVAKTLGIKENAVRTRISRGMKKLRKLLEDEERQY